MRNIIFEQGDIEECEFCGAPATKVETFDRQVHVCNDCYAGDDYE